MKKLLDEQIIPVLEGWKNFNSTIIMLDGAPAHHSNAVFGVIDEFFPGRWMGRGTIQFPSPYPWSARSPDLTPMDYWFWGDLKSKVYADGPPETLDDLKDRIATEIDNIPQESIRNAFASYERRLKVIIEGEGESVEVRSG